MEYKEFNYKDMPDGVVWIFGTAPQFDPEDGSYEGYDKPFTSLVNIEQYLDGDFSIEPIERSIFGDYDDIYSITHYSDYIIPPHPGHLKCSICDGPNDIGEICRKCSIGNDPFISCSGCASDLKDRY